MKLIERMKRSITQRKSSIVLTRDFTSMASKSRVNECLKALVDQGKLARIGYGVYAKTVLSTLSGKMRPCKVLEELAAEAFDRLHIPYALGRAQQDYAAGRTTQIPCSLLFAVGKRRISRKLCIGARSVRYENTRSC